MIEQALAGKMADFRELGFPEYMRREGRIHRAPHVVSILVGARRVGKSFCAMQFADDLIKEGFLPSLSHVCHVDFDHPVLGKIKAEELSKIQTIFLQQNPAFTQKTPLLFILDEIHRVSGWEDYAIELSRNPHWQVVITGSSARMLSKDISTALRGKSVSTTITPLSFRDFLRFRKMDPDGVSTRQQASIRAAFEDYLRWGAFPAIPQTPDFTKPALLHEYYDTMLLRDIIQRHSIRAADDCIALYTYLLSSMSKPFTVQSAQRYLAGAGYKTGREAIAFYIDYAEDARLFQTLALHTDSAAQAARNYRKIYAVDWALANCNSATWDGTHSRALENMVYMELTRRYSRIRYGLTRSDHREIDFIADDTGGQPVFAAQVSLDVSDPETYEREIAPLAAVAQYHQIPDVVLITRSDERTVEHNGVTIRIVPAWKWLLNVNHE
jgi:predicted AAA+ superfamily ATPase